MITWGVPMAFTLAPSRLIRFPELFNPRRGKPLETLREISGQRRNLMAVDVELTPDDVSPNMEIKRSGSQPSGKGPGDWFKGTVRIDPLFQPNAPARTGGAHVTFEPGARTAWHTHPLGQTLIVTSGCGRAQRLGGPVEEIRPGDVVWFPPGEKHWHGAAPATAVTHIAIQEQLDGKFVDWLEQVSEEQYRADPKK
jgi:quercetin dioxygenase-like cupin family protein